MLQAQKSKLKGFDDWYAVWREAMRADGVMRWLIEARNHIEKQGDLETYSELKARVISSYLDEMEYATIEGNLFDGVNVLLSRVPPCYLASQVIEHGALQIERRWVANSLPTHELLSALSHVYRELELCLQGACERWQCSVPADFCGGRHCEGDGRVDSGHLRCMAGRPERVETIISLKDGSQFEISRQGKTFSREELEGARKHYGVTRGAFGAEKPSGLRETASYFFKQARHVFLVDGYHGPMAFLLKDGVPVGMIQLDYPNRNAKYLVSRELAEAVRLRGADAIIHVGEAWTASLKDLWPLQYPVDAATRGEQLLLSACSREETFQLSAEIVRFGEYALLAETIETDLAKREDMFSPIREAWRQMDRTGLTA
ncbi:hypothetical protein PPN31119_04460 [Pandoraea pnomenusa]|uniref:Uncharacterized protein n=1 Tax=Pandoraea pnomenusa TaxID=93220 RepID=A0ABY6WPZ0_9BURK|nr:hypothetical protein PPN31119_04460 [Pandoraea pnomenusa]